MQKNIERNEVTNSILDNLSSLPRPPLLYSTKSQENHRKALVIVGIILNFTEMHLEQH